MKQKFSSRRFFSQVLLAGSSRRFFSQVLLAGIVLFSISCAKNFEAPNFNTIKPTSVSGKYEYFFKVILSENTPLSRSQEGKIQKNIAAMTEIFEKKAMNHKSYRANSSSFIITPAYTMAVLMSSNEVKRMGMEIQEQGGKLLFSCEHLLMDQTGQGPVFDGVSRKNTPQSKVFTVKHRTILKDISHWDSISFFFPSKTRNVSENSQIPSFEIPDATVVQNLMDQSIAFLADMDGATITVNGDTAEIMSGDAYFEVEFDPNELSTATMMSSETRFIGKLFKKAKKLVCNYVKDKWNQIKNAYNDFMDLRLGWQIGLGVFLVGGAIACSVYAPCSVSVSFLSLSLSFGFPF